MIFQSKRNNLSTKKMRTTAERKKKPPLNLKYNMLWVCQNDAEILYNLFNEKLKEKINVETGIFGSDMRVNITNDGPVTIVMESR